MKKKTLIITLISVSMALIVAAVGVTLAWYTSRSADRETWELTADGFVILQFQEDITTSDTKLKPAILKKGYLNNGIEDYSVDVLNSGDPAIEEVATQVTYEGFVQYINGAAAGAGERDANMTIDVEVYMEFEDGETATLSLDRDIGLILDVRMNFTDSAGTAETLENVPPGKPFYVKDNCTLTVDIKMWLKQPDELCSPYILGAKSVKLQLKISADADFTEPAPDPTQP